MGKRSWWVAGIAVSALAACAPMPPAGAPAPAAVEVAEETKGPPPTVGLAERFAWQTAEQMRDALVAKDVAGFMAKISSGYYKGYAALEARLRSEFETTARVSVGMEFVDVASEENRVWLRLKWRRTLTRLNGATDRVEGVTQFVFHRTDTLRLIDYRGDALFGLGGS